MHRPTLVVYLPLPVWLDIFPELVTVASAAENDALFLLLLFLLSMPVKVFKLLVLPPLA